MRVSEIRVKQIRVNQGLGVIAFGRMLLELFIRSFSLSNNSNLIQLETKRAI